MSRAHAHPPQRVDAVLFDFDYTLADSSRGVVECIRFALDALGLPQVTPDEACRTIGLSLPETFRILTGQTEDAETFQRLFIERAEAVMTDSTVILEQARPTLAQLQAAGVALGIVSTKFRRRIEEILGREGLGSMFGVIVGGEDVSAPKPDPEGLHRAIARLGCDQVLYVGDSLTDARTAVCAGVPFVAVCTGTTPRAAFGDYATYAVLDDLTELLPLVLDHTQRSQPW
ncbi:MAG: HAD-IA family hydrolase [Anaerolineae bacterium]|nr:HAD-IA family hydrolase [Anaerolineae bacterium]